MGVNHMGEHQSSSINAQPDEAGINELNVNSKCYLLSWLRLVSHVLRPLSHVDETMRWLDTRAVVV